MSLAERVQAAQRQRQGASGSGPRRLTVEDLRNGVKEHISMESIAAILVENPERARNELRVACRQAFADLSWSELSLQEKRALTDELIDLIFGMGPIDAMLRDESITEIMINGSQSIFYERDGRLFRSDARFESDEQVRVLIDRIIGPLGRRIDEASPMVNARLPEGHRVHAVIPPISPDGPMVTIRAFARRAMTLEEMMVGGSFSAREATFLRWAVLLRKNIAVSGGTGSGKTTLLNALSHHIPPEERIITIEDSAELKFTEHPHVVRLEARPRNAEGTGEITIRDLVINALRMRPDRIIVGECRSGEAIDMLQAMNTGHDGSLTTLHANAPREVVDRLVTMCRYAVDLPIDAIEAQIGNALDLIIQTARSYDGMRFLSEIAELSFDPSSRRCRIDTLYTRDPDQPDGEWSKLPSWFTEVSSCPLISDEEVEAWGFQRA